MSEQGKAVLLVEDDPDLRDVTSMMLESEGYRVITAGDGRSALDEVAREMPGVILLDMRMAGMPGWEFAREFHTRYGRAAPIVALTAAQNTAEQAAEIGADGYLSKPYDMDDLLAMVARFLNSPT